MQLEAERGSSLDSARMRGIVRKSIPAIQAQALGVPQWHTQEPCLIIHQTSLPTLYSLRGFRVLRGECFSPNSYEITTVSLDWTKLCAPLLLDRRGQTDSRPGHARSVSRARRTDQRRSS